MINWRYETHQTVSSTQDIVKQKAAKGVQEGLVVRAEKQTAGRGRHGRSWADGQGNLYVSFLLKPDCTPDKLGQISLLTGLSLYQTVASLIGNNPALTLKWPNDILLQGKKCCGILLETDLSPAGKIEALIVGFGLNTRTTPMEGSCCLADFSETLPDNKAVLSNILEIFARNYKKWQSDGFSDIRKHWSIHSHKKGDAMSVKIGDIIKNGKFDGIDEQGNLLLLSDADGKIKKITAGEVFCPA